MFTEYESDRHTRLAEALVDWVWAKEAERGWEQELQAVELRLGEARRECELRLAEYLALKVELKG
jgi:hypothetical protein